MLLLHLSEAAGIVAAASSVRTTAGTLTGLVSLLCMAAVQIVTGRPAPLILPVALVMLLLLRTNRSRMRVASGAAAIVLPFAVLALSSHYPVADITPVQLVFAVPSAVWLVLALKGKDGAAIAMTGPPLALLLADVVSARILLIASGVALGGLLTKSYQLKRAV